MEILKLADIKEGIIAHQVNCQGIMGAGTALAIRKLYPKAFQKYREQCLKKNFAPGLIQLIRISDTLVICNMAGQNYYGRDKQYTDYIAVEKCLFKLSTFAAESGLQVYIPFKMGCRLGGGDWEVVEALVLKILPLRIYYHH